MEAPNYSRYSVMSFSVVLLCRQPTYSFIGVWRLPAGKVSGDFFSDVVGRFVGVLIISLASGL